MRRCGMLLLSLAFLTVLLSGCFGWAKGKIVDPKRVAEAVRAFEEENLRLEPIEREKEWILEGVKPVRYTLFEPSDELDESLREQLSIYVFKSEEHRIAGLEDFYCQTAALNMLFPRIYAYEEIMMFYWAAAALDETTRFGEALERVVNRLAGTTVYFNASHAVDRVLQLRPEFPKPGKTGTVTLSVGGPAPGLTVEGVTRTEVEPEVSANAKAISGEEPAMAAGTKTETKTEVEAEAEPKRMAPATAKPEADEGAEAEAYIVTLIKEWNAEIGGEKIISTWRYRVTRDKVELLESADQDWRLNVIK